MSARVKPSGLTERTEAMSDKKPVIGDEEYSELVTAASGLGKQLDTLIKQVKEFQQSCEQNRLEIERLKEDFRKQKEEQEELIEKALAESFRKIEDDICAAVQTGAENKLKNLK